MTTPCAEQSLVDAHFSLDISPEQEQRLRAHLPQCPSCHERYRRLLLLAHVDPAQPSGEARLARGLGFRGRPRPSLGLGLALAATAAVVALVAGSGLWRAPSDPYTARGSATQAAFFAFRLHDGRSEPLRSTMVANDELAFSYVNAGAFKRVLIFGVDARQAVHWYHPAWVDPNDNPVAITIEPAERPRELGQAVRHPLAPGSLTLYGVFTDEALTVKDVEARLARHDLAFSHAEVRTTVVEVTP